MKTKTNKPTEKLELLSAWWQVLTNLYEAFEVDIYRHVDLLTPGQLRLLTAVEDHFDWLGNVRDPRRV